MVPMKNKARYVLDLFRSIYAVPAELVIHYGEENRSEGVRIRPNHSGFFNSRTRLDVSKIVWKSWREQRIPFLFNREAAEVISREAGQVVINLDIVAASFFFLSGWQELVSTERDHFGRFPLAASVQAALDVVHIPVVNYYFDILKVALEQAYKIELQRQLWPDCDFAVFLSHDIDKCQSGWLEGGFSELRHGRLASAMNLLSRRITGQDDWFNFDVILDVEKQNAAHSSFYFLCQNGKRAGVQNADYDILDSKLTQSLAAIQESGCEIGLHGSFGTHNNLTRFRSDLNRLPVQAVGNRFHFLAFDMTSTPHILEDAGIKYDTTLGFADKPGFRNGICFPFNLYDVANDQPLNVVEIPLAVMDTTLQSQAYLGVSPGEAWPHIENVMAQVRNFGGCLSVLWHNTHFSDYKYTGWRQVYVDLLRHISEHGGGLMIGKDVLAEYETCQQATCV